MLHQLWHEIKISLFPSSLPFSDLELPEAWVTLRSENATEYIYMVKVSVDKDPVILKTLTVNRDNTWIVRIVGHPLTAVPFDVPKYLDEGTEQELINQLDRLHVCVGNYDDCYFKFCTPEGRIGNSAFLDRHGILTKGQFYKATIRSDKCQLLVNSPGKCRECLKTNNVLRAMKSRSMKSSDDRTAASSKTKFTALNKEELEERCRNVSKAYKSLKQKSSRLLASLEKATAEEGRNLGHGTSTSFRLIVNEEEGSIMNKYKEGTFGHLFWSQQRDAANRNDGRGHRWHPMFIKWCINLRLTSAKGYRTLRDSNILQLPCDTTLRNYIHWTEPVSGLHPPAIQQLKREIKFEEREEHQKLVVVIHDEMKIKEDLVYQKSTGRLVGFTDLGDVQNDLRAFEQRVSRDTAPESDIATHMFVIMVRGLFFNFTYPVAHFPTHRTSADEIFALVWRSVEALEWSGLKVVAITCDGAATNRKFGDMDNSHQGPNSGPIFKVKNSWARDKPREVFLMQDPPHLVKCVRNSWFNSYANQKTRMLWVRSGNALCSSKVISTPIGQML